MNLAGLELTDNLLAGLPKEIINLVKLTDLGLGGNQLTALPKKWIQSVNNKTIVVE